LLRRCGAAGVIVACACTLALAGSPQLHEHMHHVGTGTGHACAITLLDAGKCIKGIESKPEPVVVSAAMFVPLAKLPRLSPVWVRKLYLDACRCEHGPPRFS